MKHFHTTRRSAAVLAASIIITVAAMLALAVPGLAADPGETIWTRSWSAGGIGDQFSLVKACAGGDMVVAGESMTSLGRHIVVARFAPSGKRRWVRRIDAAGPQWDGAQALAVDRRGNALVAGQRVKTDTDYDVLVVKITPRGRLAWERVIDGGISGFDTAASVVVDRDGNAYVPCRAESGAGIASVTYKLRARDGATSWSRELSGTNTVLFPNDIAIDGRRNTYITGTGYEGVDDHEMVTVKLSSSGSVRWIRELPGEGTLQTEGRFVTLGPSGSLYVAGSLMTGPGSTDVILVKYRTNGDFSWRDDWDASGAGIGFDTLAALAVDRSANAFVTGYHWTAPAGTYHAFVARWRPDKTRWTASYSATDETWFGFFGLVPDNAGGCYVAGGVVLNYGDGGSEVEVGYYARYRSSGKPRWERAYVCPGRRASFAGMAMWPGRGLCLVGDASDWDGLDRQALVQLRQR